MTKNELASWGNNYRADRFLAHSNMVIPRSEIKYTLRRSTKVQLASWDEAIQLLDAKSLGPELDYECRVIKEIISASSETGEEESVFNNLTLRDAFTSEWCRSNVDPSKAGKLIRKLVLGHGSKGRGSMPHLGIATATIRFIYEVTLNFPNNKDMVPDEQFTLNNGFRARTFKDYDLNRLVLDHADEVEALIALVVKHGTLDHEVLGRMLLAPDTALSLNAGIL